MIFGKIYFQWQPAFILLRLSKQFVKKALHIIREMADHQNQSIAILTLVLATIKTLPMQRQLEGSIDS